MSETTYFAWKHTETDAIFQSDFFDPDYRGGLFESKVKAFEAFREYIGQEHVCESIQDNFRLAEVRVEETEPMDVSDCSNCPWGLMKQDEEGWFECDACGNREYRE